jgi:DNA-binding MarR family transcriptional regulator
MKIDSCTEPQALAWQHFDRMRIRLIGQINRDLMHRTGISEADFSILNELAHAGNETVRALALRGGLEWEKSRLSHQIRRMEERGLLVREPCAEDSRGSVIRLTETGAAVALDAIEQYAAIVRRHVFDRLSPAQIAALDDISATLLDALEREDDVDSEPEIHQG